MRRMIHSVGRNMTYKKVKVAVALLSSIAVGWVSITLSKEGIGFKDEGAWMGYAIAIALTCSQLIFTDAYEELSWTLLLLGLGGYIYSIHTNIIGVYDFRGTTGTLFTNFNLENFLGGIFIDVYPEAALAWALGAGKVGDALGNLVKTWMRPEQLLTASPAKRQMNTSVIQKLPKKPQVVQANTNLQVNPDEEIEDEEDEDEEPTEDGFVPLNYPDFIQARKN